MAEEIGGWLQCLGLGKYVDVFVENEITLETLCLGYLSGRHLIGNDVAVRQTEFLEVILSQDRQFGVGLAAEEVVGQGAQCSWRQDGTGAVLGGDDGAQRVAAG